VFKIKYEVVKFKGTEGNYKNKEVAKRHIRKLQKRYPGTKFNIEHKNNKKEGDLIGERKSN